MSDMYLAGVIWRLANMTDADSETTGETTGEATARTGGTRLRRLRRMTRWARSSRQRAGAL